MLIRIYRFLKRAKLRTKLFISFLAVALLPMIGMGAFSAVYCAGFAAGSAGKPGGGLR